MCGIYGMMRFDGQAADASAVRRMGRALLHRGPDDEGYHVDGALAIGMRRLAIIDLAGGHQPLSDSSGTLWLVCNGEIYNFRQLRRELEACGHVFRTGSDCEVIIHAYAQYGDAFVTRLNGMFAFALWDAARRRLVIARDRLGIKPLYLGCTPRRLAFASEAKALLALQDQPTAMDESALATYLRVGYVPAPQSLFRGIRKLPPATLLVIEDGRVEQRAYWTLPAQVDRRTTEGEWVERVRARIGECVRAQTVSDVPVGAFLSGGVDSSAVVAHLAAHGSRVRTYSIGFSGDGAGKYYNELPRARQVAQRFATDHHEIVVRPDVAALLPGLLWQMDEPVCDSAFITTYLVSQFARRDVKVILSGVGGDELFGGYRRYLGSHYRDRFARLPAWLQRSARAAAMRLPSDRHAALLDVARLARQFLESVDLPFDQRYAAYVEVFHGDDVARLLADPGVPTAGDAIAQSLARLPGADGMNRLLRVDAATQLPDDLLLLTDKMSMAVSLECRVPLLDHELAEIAAVIPEDIKVRHGRLKHVMKEALAPLLPGDVLDGRKRGFGAPIGSWLRNELKPLVAHLLSRSAVEGRGLFRYEAVRELVRAHDEKRIDGTDRLLALVNLELWARMYLDTRAPADVQAEVQEALA